MVVWHMGAHKEVERFSAFPTGAFAAAFDPMDTEVAVGGLDDSVVVHQIGGGGDARLSGHGKAVGALAFSSDRKLLAAGTAAGAVVLWRRDPWTRQARFKSTNHLCCSLRSATMIVKSCRLIERAIG